MTTVNGGSAALAVAVGLALFAPLSFDGSHAQQRPAAPPPEIDADDIGGVVTGPNGPEAGVWVIAETRDLPVRYIKIVVTDDQGRYVIPVHRGGAMTSGRAATGWWTASSPRASLERS